MVKQLNSDFKSADAELGKTLDELTDEFDKRCAITQKATQFLVERVADERLQETSSEGQIRAEYVLGEQMEQFRTLHLEKKHRLNQLSKEYEAIQRRIVELAIIVLGEDEVRIGIDQNRDRNTLGIDEVAVISERNVFHDTYETAFRGLADFRPEVSDCSEDALAENEKTIKVMHSQKPPHSSSTTDHWTRLCKIM